MDASEGAVFYTYFQNKMYRMRITPGMQPNDWFPAPKEDSETSYKVVDGFAFLERPFPSGKDAVKPLYLQ